MGTLTLLGIAVGLAMDAFAVSIGVGLKLCTVDRRQTFRLSFHFGLFQALMPVVGWLAGLTLADLIEAVDHWIAFGLLAFIGGRMLYEAFRGEEGVAGMVKDPTRGTSLVVLSVATSIDALAVGLSLALLRIDIWYPAVVIGLVAAAFTFVGLRIGCRFGSLLGRRMEAVGGVILILIGFRILIEHLDLFG
jgi:manganese efflux pump family protein